MKRLFLIIAAAAGLCLAARAQTNLNASSQSFLTSAELYFTTFSTDTNQWWAGTSFELSTGYRQVTGAGAQNDTDFQKDLARFNLGLAMQYSGVGSTVNGLQGQAGYAMIQYCDTEADLNLRAGYGLNSQLVRAGVIEPGVMLKKLQTRNTATEIGMSFPIFFKGKFNNTPTFTIAEVIRF